MGGPMTNTEIKRLAVELYKLASDGALTSSQAEELIKSAVADDAYEETKEKINLEHLYLLYPAIQGRIRYMASNNERKIGGKIAHFDGNVFWFDPHYIYNSEAIKISRFISRNEDLIQNLEEILQAKIANDDTKDNGESVALHICTAFEAYLSDSDVSTFRGGDMLRFLIRIQKELV
jgi:hypothetical protein